MPARERISHVDTAWLRMDRPSNLMQIVGVMLFEGKLDYERLRLSIERRMLGFSRFRQVVHQDASHFAVTASVLPPLVEPPGESNPAR